MRPAYLKKGDRVAVVATAKKLKPGQIDGALDTLRSWGLDVVLGSHLYNAHGLFAGRDADRAADLQQALDDPSVKAVIFARGGYGTNRVVERIDWTTFINQPKWLCGFSDLTVIHHHVHRNWGIESLHSTMPIFFADGEENEGSKSLKSALFGEQNGLGWNSLPMGRKGNASGTLIGGNLSVIHSILGTPSDADWSGKVLFLEDLTEYLYHLDRMMVHLKRAGRLEDLAGLVVGQFSDMAENDTPYGMTAEEIIWDAVKEYDYPVAFDAPIGHVKKNLAVFSGGSVRLDVGSEEARLQFAD